MSRKVSVPKAKQKEEKELWLLGCCWQGSYSQPPPLDCILASKHNSVLEAATLESKCSSPFQFSGTSSKVPKTTTQKSPNQKAKVLQNDAFLMSAGSMT